MCEYNCAFSNSDETDMVKALKDVHINPRIRIEEAGDICFAVSCRHCAEPLCARGCIMGAISITNGVIVIDQDKCVGCCTCILMCPYGAVMPAGTGVMQKCELCMENAEGEPACVKGCPNRAIVFEEREA